MGEPATVSRFGWFNSSRSIAAARKVADGPRVRASSSELRELRRETWATMRRGSSTSCAATTSTSTFDMQLATSRLERENPVYYIQYAHARVCSVLRQMREKGFDYDASRARSSLHRWFEAHEQALLASMAGTGSRGGRRIAAVRPTPRLAASTCAELAKTSHVLQRAPVLGGRCRTSADARLTLIQGLRQVCATGSGVLGVSAPEAM